MHNIKHLFFDLDNTLWDFDTNSREAVFELFNKHSIENKCNTSFQNFISEYEKINHNLWHLLSTKQTTKEELRYQRFYKTFNVYGYDNITLAKLWADDYLKISPYKTQLIDGTIEVLNYLQTKYQLHIITNGFKEVQQTKLNCCGLRPYFKNIIISEEHDFNKPDIKIFELAETLSNAQKNECVMIGDNYDTDIEGSINANWQAIYLSKSNANKKIKNVTQINHLKALMDIL